MTIQTLGRRRARWVVLSAAALALSYGAWRASSGTPAGLPVPAAQAQMVQGLPDFTRLVDAVGPSVVNIRVLQKVDANDNSGVDPDMLEFFRRFGIPVPPGFQGNPRGGGGEPRELPRGVGSGFIVSSDGYIMTNAHVVEGADDLVVTLPDKREFKGRIVGSDKRTDVAVVKIDAQDLPAVRMGDATRLRVGEWVVAIGSPYGLSNTVTAGIVSAKQRDTGDYLPFIQTDVAINPGNSGGPLINMSGEVVGINSQIYSRSGGFQGISFAIPIDEAQSVADQLRAKGFVTRGRIGVSISGLDQTTAEALGLDKSTGALVRGVEAKSPASKAGIRPGDVITRFAGKAIESPSDLPRAVGRTKPGEQAEVQVWREGKTRTLRIVVGTYDSDTQAAANAQPSKQPKPVELAEWGLRVRALTNEEKAQAGGRGGVMVLRATAAAQAAGLREDDVIMMVANQAVDSPQALEQALTRAAKTKPFSLLYRRGEWLQYTLVR
ncbi:MAG: Do family serine endopeptidase [Burkholderiaceae bacterium]